VHARYFNNHCRNFTPQVSLFGMRNSFNHLQILMPPSDIPRDLCMCQVMQPGHNFPPPGLIVIDHS